VCGGRDRSEPAQIAATRSSIAGSAIGAAGPALDVPNAAGSAMGAQEMTVPFLVVTPHEGGDIFRTKPPD
jgi:hypothetical protein